MTWELYNNSISISMRKISIQVDFSFTEKFRQLSNKWVSTKSINNILIFFYMFVY